MRGSSLETLGIRQIPDRGTDGEKVQIDNNLPQLPVLRDRLDNLFPIFSTPPPVRLASEPPGKHGETNSNLDYYMLTPSCCLMTLISFFVCLLVF